MKKIIKIIGIVLISVVLMSLLIEVVDAYQIDAKFKPANEPFDIKFDSDNAQQTGTPGSYATIIILQLIAGTLLYFAAPVAIVMLAAAGWQMTTGGAETEKLEQAKKNITWTIVGLLAIILSYSIVKFAIGFVITAADVEPLPEQPPAEETIGYQPSTPLIAEIERLLS